MTVPAAIIAVAATLVAAVAGAFMTAIPATARAAVPASLPVRPVANQAG